MMRNNNYLWRKVRQIYSSAYPSHTFIFPYIQKGSNQQMDGLASILIYVAFNHTHAKASLPLIAGRYYNYTHIGLWLLFSLPLVLRVLHQMKRGYRVNLQLQYHKQLGISSVGMVLFCVVGGCLSMGGLLMMIGFLFEWVGYDYIFCLGCVGCCSLSTIINYMKVRLDCVFVFCVEVYKFFVFVMLTIVFGIIIRNKELNTIIIATCWLYAVYRVKDSLQRGILYYLILFLQLTFYVTAAILLLASPQSHPSATALLFGVLAGVGIMGWQVRGLLRSYNHDVNFDVKEKNPSKIFYQISGLASVAGGVECAICLDSHQMYPSIRLPCNHSYHINCIYEWMMVSECCPMCRSKIVTYDESEQIFYC